MTVGGPGPMKLEKGLQKPDDDTRLRKTATQMEGLFVQKMFAAMRETVNSDDGIMPQSSAEDNFTQMLDEKFSEKVPEEFAGSHSLAQALYNQLRKQLPGADTTTKASATAQTITTALHPKSTAPTSLRPTPASAPAPAKL
ncbi:MAG TPA: rod-binding protein [Gemmatimonadaceae bacterium]|jgi:flagellar protein FlgJ